MTRPLNRTTPKALPLTTAVVTATLALAAAGCLSAPDDGGPIVAEPIHVDGPLDVDASCSKRRWVAVLDPEQASCPRLEGWNGFPLSDDAPLEVVADLKPEVEVGRQESAAAGAESGTALAGFCVYEWQGAGEPVGEEIAALEGLGFEALDPDCRVVVPLVGPSAPSGLLERASEALERQFMEQTGEAPLRLVPGRERVRLTLIDTLPGTGPPSENEEGASNHAYSLANMAERLLDDGSGGLIADVGARLALDQYWGRRAAGSGPNDFVAGWRSSPLGGLRGDIGRLAAVIEDEVDAWRAEAVRPLDPVRRPLVINLSIGWESSSGGYEPLLAGMPASVQAVHRALEYASCAGALVVAAAGNTTGGPTETPGPMLPAGWEVRAAPSAATCAAFRGLPPLVSPAGIYRPLLHAAGAVRADGRPLPNSRESGSPRLVAYGDHAVAEVEPDPDGDPQVTGTLTGSSVASLVVSGAAAAVWYYNPGLPSWEVMETIYDAAESRGRTADFCLGGDTPLDCPSPGEQVRQVSIAHAVHLARGGGGPAITPAAREPIRLPDTLLPDGRAVPIGSPTFARSDFRSRAVHECGGVTVLALPGRALAGPCPHLQFHGVLSNPGVGPQPDSDPCPNCGVGNSDLTLWIEIDESYFASLDQPGDLVLSAPTLKRVRPDGRSERFRLPGSLIQRGRMNGLVLSDVATIDDRLSLELVVTGRGSAARRSRMLSIPLLSVEHADP